MLQVLIIDDEPMVKIALKTLIHWEEHGFSICASASDGKEALDLIGKFQPEIIITDLKMPVMDGLELITELKKMHYPGKVLVISNYGDYEYVRQALKLGAIDYMLKISLNKEELLAQLKNCSDLLSASQSSRKTSAVDFTLNELFLKSYFMDMDFTYEKLKESQFPTFRPYYMCYITQPFQKKFTGRKGDALSWPFIQNLLLENFSYLSPDSFIPIHGNSFIILYDEQSAKKTNLDAQELGKRVIDYFSQFLSLSLYAIVSKTALYLEELKQICFQCPQLALSAFYDFTSPVYADELHLQHHLSPDDYRPLASELISILSQNDVPDSLEALDLFLEQCEIKKVHPEVLKNHLFQMCCYMELFLASSGCIDILALQESIEKCKNCTELKETLKVFFCQLNQLLKSDTRFYKKEVVECIRYIRKHYQEKFTLADLSSSVGMSENYLCKIFKNDTGISIIQYTQNFRMEKAAALIAENNLSFGEIADAVGISDQFYFNRIFKKTYGMTPSQYRRQKSFPYKTP